MGAAQRHGHDPGRGQLQRDRVRLCPLPKLGEGRLLLALDRLGQLALPARVHVALECGRQFAARILEESAHVADQLLALTARERDGNRPPRFMEVVQVHPVPGRRPVARLLVQLRLERGPFADADRAGDEDVVARHSGLQPEPDRLGRPVLADGTFNRWHLLGRAEAEGFRRVRSSQRPRLEFPCSVRDAHRWLLALRSVRGCLCGA